MRNSTTAKPDVLVLYIVWMDGRRAHRLHAMPLTTPNMSASFPLPILLPLPQCCLYHSSSWSPLFHAKILYSPMNLPRGIIFEASHILVSLIWIYRYHFLGVWILLPSLPLLSFTACPPHHHSPFFKPFDERNQKIQPSEGITNVIYI